MNELKISIILYYNNNNNNNNNDIKYVKLSFYNCWSIITGL